MIDDLREYVSKYAFETVLCDARDEHGNLCGGAWKTIAVNLGNASMSVLDGAWKKPCPTCNGLHHQFCSGSCRGQGYIEPYDLAIAFCRRADSKWEVRLYSTKPEIDCGAIAKAFGGSGSRNEAEFVCAELPFEI